MKSNFVAQKEVIDPRVVVGRRRPATVRLPRAASKWVAKKARPGAVRASGSVSARGANGVAVEKPGKTVGITNAGVKRGAKGARKALIQEGSSSPALTHGMGKVGGAAASVAPVAAAASAGDVETIAIVAPVGAAVSGGASGAAKVAAPETRQPYDENTALRLYLKDAVEVDLLTPEQEVELAHRIRAGDENAREHMIRANLRLVVKIAREYEDFGLPLLDLINEGNIGLMHAVERFDPSKGAKLSTYAAWWIKQSIRRALSNQSKAIRLPIHVVQELARMKKAESRLEAELGRPPSEGELAAELDGTLEDIVRWRQAAAIGATSLDAPLGNDPDSNRVADVVADENSRMPWSDVAAETDAALVRELVNTLNAREQTILRRRFALDGGEPETLETIGASFGLTRERIRQLEAAALKKLKDRLRKREAMQLAA